MQWIYLALLHKILTSLSQNVSAHLLSDVTPFMYTRVPEKGEGVVSSSGARRCPCTDHDMNSHCRHGDKPEQQDDCF